MPFKAGHSVRALPHLGTGINAWEKIERETQGSWALLGWLWEFPLVLRTFLLGKKSVPATTFCSNSSIDFLVEFAVVEIE